MERIGADRLAAEREVDRNRRRRYVRALVECAGSSLVGVVIMGTAFHATDRGTGEILLSAGMIVGYSGGT